MRGSGMRRLPFSVRCATSLRRRPQLVRDAKGFSLIETVMAMVILAIIAVALVALLESAIAANGLGRQKTVAQQLAQDQVEWIRQLDYTTEIGIPGGNPNGVIPATRPITVRGVSATMTTDVDWVNDPTLASYSAVANYKKVTVSIKSNRNNAVLTTIVTFVAPPGRAPFGGLNNAVINVNVQDMGLIGNNSLPGVLINLGTGPSAPLSDTTDSAGLVTFPGLTANPSTGSQAFYDLTATKSGYITYVADRSPLSPAHLQVAPSETAGRTIRMYKPATINVALTNSSGNPYIGAATVKVTSPLLALTQTYSTSTGSLVVTAFAGDPVVPGDFTIRAFTPTGNLCASPVARYVPDNYPTVMSSTYTLQLLPCPFGTLQVNVTQLGGPAPGAAVTVTGGPNDFLAITQSTNASGQTNFTNLPSGSDPYTISVTDAPGNVTATGSAVIATGATTPVTIPLGNPPMGSISALVQWLGSNVSGATVAVTGGPYNVSLSGGPTGGSGTVSFSNNVPAGTGYTVTATKGGQTKIVTGVSVTAGSTTSVTLAMPTSTITVTTTWAGKPIGVGTNNVSIAGGPDSTNGPYLGSTDVNGQAVVMVPQSAVSYTVSVTKSPGSGSAVVASVPSTGASVAVTFAQTGVLTVTANWAAKPAGNQGGTNTITVYGGPIGVVKANGWTGPTNASGQVAFTVPITSGGFPAYTVDAAKNAGTGTVSVTTVLTTGSAATVTMTPTKTLTITVKRGSPLVNLASTSVIVSITGGPNGVVGSTPAYGGTFTTNASGVLPAITVPSGAGGYTVKVYLNNCALFATYRSGSTAAVVSTGTTNLAVPVNFTVDVAPCPFTPLP
jgi:prepilin-type N-terminal cleavage/methylation domain-containing protein